MPKPNEVSNIFLNTNMESQPMGEQAGRIHDSQGGGRPGRSAIDLACKKIVLYDHIRITRTPAIDISKDVAKCFDRMMKHA